jgi:hypothetical protein
MIIKFACVLTALGLLASPAFASAYPIAGKWTNDHAVAAGPAKTCRTSYMEFHDTHRFDSAGGIREYRNVSVSGAPPVWRIVDQFFAVQIRGRVSYTLRLIDPDHVELQLGDSGKRIKLRRCTR